MNPPGPSFLVGEGHADVAVVVVTYQNVDDIDPLLASLRDEAVDQRIRVVVADNASTDGTPTRARSHPDVIVLDTGGNLGYAGGINAAMAVVGDASAILILNPDLELERGCVRRLRDRLDQTGAGIVVPTIVTADGERADSLRHEPTVMRALGDATFGSRWPRRPALLTQAVRAPRDYASPHRITWATGAALLVSRAAADRVGPWDERFFLFSEETDFFHRVRSAGFSIWFEPAARVVHREGGSGRSPELVALTIVNAIRYAELHRPRTAGAHRVVLALHELRRWDDPSHRIARTILLDRRRWADLPAGDRPAQQPGAAIDHLLVTRFNLPSEGAERLIRARDGWLHDRVGLFERHTVPSVRSQTTQDFGWLIYFDTQSPAWLVERLRPLVDAGLFTPVYRDVVTWQDVLADAHLITGAQGEVLLTTNLDNDDALASDFVQRLQQAVRPGVREALFIERGLILAGDRLYQRVDRVNAFCSVAEPWADAVTSWRDWHTLLSRRMPTRTIDGPPGWLQVIHDRNVSNRVRGRLVSPVRFRRLFPEQLDDVPRPTARTVLAELIHAPLRAGREIARASGKAILMRVLGKEGLGRFREKIRRLTI